MFVAGDGDGERRGIIANTSGARTSRGLVPLRARFQAVQAHGVGRHLSDNGGPAHLRCVDFCASPGPCLLVVLVVLVVVVVLGVLIVLVVLVLLGVRTILGVRTVL